MATKFPVQGEVELDTKFFRNFKGVVNNSARNALPEEAWFYLENIQTIGAANAQTVPNISAQLADYSAHNPYWSQYANVGGVDYLITFCVDGTVQAYNIVAQTTAQIGTGLSGNGSRFDQWKNTQVLIIDSSGYYNWPGSGTITLITGAGVPSAGTDIAVGFGRVWIVNGRLLTFSGPDDFSATSFLVANGAGSLALTDPTIRNVVSRLKYQNGYLYLVSASGINVISDVYVPTGASPPTPRFTNLNIQNIIGSDQPGSVYNYNQALVFANRYGAWYLYGTNATKISTDVDGTWKYIDFSQGISGGQVVVNNILCTGFLIKRLNDPVFGSNVVLAMYNDEKWWFANYGALTFVMTGLVTNAPALFGFIGGKLFQLFANNTSAPATLIKTALWDMEDPLADKQIIRAGFEVTVQILSGSFVMYVDSVNNSQQAVNLNAAGGVSWINNANNVVQWQNNALAIVTWSSSSYLLYNGTAPGVFQKYVGVTIQASASAYQLSSIFLDYKKKARWV